MANLRTNNLSGEQGQNAYRGSVFFDGSSFLSFNAAIWNSTASDSCTFECWLWVADLNSARNIFDLGNLGDFSIQTDGQVRVHPVNSNWMDTNNSITTRSWHHIALVQESGRKDVYINGVKSSMTVGAGDPVSSSWSNTNANTFNLGDDGTYRDFFRGYMSNVRVLKGVALYDDDFTPPFTELKATDPNTSLLCCQNSDDVTQEETGKTITGNGSLATAGYNKTQPKIIPPYGVDAGNTFGGPIQQSSQGYMYFPTGRTAERGRGRGVIMGGCLSPTGYLQDIYYVEIQSTGNAFQFGDLTASRYSGGGCGSSTRGLIGGGRRSNGDRIDVIESIEFAITSNSIDFGDLVAGNSFCPGGGNQTRGIWMGGSNGSTTFDTIQFATIATTGNAQDFGDLRAASYAPATAASPTRMLAMGGGNPSSFFAYIDFVEIATTGNAQDFGDMSTNKNQNTGVSSNTRAVAMGGNTPSGLVNSMEFVTIATTGDATDFGDLTFGGVEHTGSVNNSIRGVQTGGRYPSYNNIMEFITIASTGNGSDFGDIPITGIAYVAGASDSHGGLS